LQRALKAVHHRNIRGARWAGDPSASEPSLVIETCSGVQFQLIWEEAHDRLVGAGCGCLHFLQAQRWRRMDRQSRSHEEPIVNISLKRAYEPAAKSDGMRVLVDRLWPRGVTKLAARIDHWVKEVAPSTELRQWFAHDPEKWAEFQKRYRAELKDNPALPELKALASGEGHLTLVYAAKDEQYNDAVVLKQVLYDGV